MPSLLTLHPKVELTAGLAVRSFAHAPHELLRVLLRMTDYEVKPPTLMFGTLETANDLAVRFDLLLRAP